jgi:hypothetical protein
MCATAENKRAALLHALVGADLQRRRDGPGEWPIKITVGNRLPSSIPFSQ